MKYFIITGTSRGLGKALGKALMDENHRVFCISRKMDRELMDFAETQRGSLEFFEFDLSDHERIRSLMDEIFQRVDLEAAEGIYLVNNAGVLAPVKRLEDCEDGEILQNLHVNLAAPLILTSAFIKKTQGFTGDKKVINISSGAGSKPHYGWANYCASKAGVNLFTRSVGLEQESKEAPVKILSLAPAIMDTKMQEEIRSSNKEDFQELEKFKNYKKEGQLLPTKKVAEKVKELLLTGDFEQGEVLDVRDLL
ncbi:(S)-benzoin forming benzil reductase [Isachenkonia alkalipeptolytica]|uniref:(S)-benzoin forming benzil reductase n=1 Tax=Isachenkonia alkalipeptolytica TaxID=2565777 RepID=A0AA43XKP0_9CLOT|nr:(S)-benzoin forming benzil reductase [Isachenkonia alkalipeptolytica]NBG88583.1 (S)-benzoin forming benzil reductase [Isachenkonia alkalipeptolytica]